MGYAQTMEYVIDNYTTASTFPLIVEVLTRYIEPVSSQVLPPGSSGAGAIGAGAPRFSWTPVTPARVLTALLNLHSKLDTIGTSAMPASVLAHARLV